MRTIAIHLLLAVTCAAVGACGSGKDTEAAPFTEDSTRTDPKSAADGASAESRQTRREPAVTPAPLEVSRTRAGNGGVIAVAGEATMEFDYSPPQGHCQASAGKFVARGIDISDDNAGVSIDYATIVAPDTGRVVGQAFYLEVKRDGYVPWSVNSALARAVEEIVLDESPGGGGALTVTGVASGFHETGAPTGTRVPFRLVATCEP